MDLTGERFNMTLLNAVINRDKLTKGWRALLKNVTCRKTLKDVWKGMLMNATVDVFSLCQYFLFVI